MPALSRVTTDAQEAMSIKFNTMVYELRRRGKDVIVMSLGEAFFDIPLFPMDDLPYPDVNHYSHSRGLPALRELLAGYFEKEHGVSFDTETEIVITAGSKAAIHMTLMSILDPGDEVLYSEPAWVSYPEQVRLCYGKPVGLAYDVPVWHFEPHITPRTRAIVITNPHNPRGYVYKEPELRHLLGLAEKHDLWLLSDEAYSEFVSDGSFVSVGRLDPRKRRVVIFNSMSKNYGISGWRIGYAIGNAELMCSVLKVNQHLITCPPTILEHYLVRHFDEIHAITRPQIRALVEKRKQLQDYMDEIGLAYLEGAGTFYFFVSLGGSRLGSEQFCTRLLSERLVSIVPGIGYGRSCDRFVRVSVGSASVEENKRGLRAIKELIDETG
jgi:aspartate aminotransferase/aminotransferase